MNLFACLNTTEWARGFRPVRCGNSACGRWVTSRQLEVRRVGVVLADCWYCSYRCFRPAAQSCIAKLLRDTDPHRYRSTHSPLGLALVRHGLISDAQYKQASGLQRQSGEDLGEVVVRLGWLNERQVTDIRATQWNCPVFPCSLAPSRMDFGLPAVLTQRYAMLPLHHSGDTLFVGFAYEIDYAALYAIESIVGCSTRPCLIMPSEFKLMASRTAPVSPLREWREHGFSTGEEITDAICQQGTASNAEQVAIVRCGSVLWCRTQSGGKRLDLLFHCKDSMRPSRISA